MSRMSHHRGNTEARDFARAELAGLREKLSCAYGIFNATSDPQLLEACILEISALHARYGSALRNIKSIDGDTEK